MPQDFFKKHLATFRGGLKRGALFENGEREFINSQSNVRESGENPERLRHCNRLQTPKSH